jgi:effector-binding domain-containing protein
MNKVRPILIVTAALVMIALSLPAQETLEKKAPEKIAEKHEEGEIKLHEIKPYSYCAIEMTGSYEQHATAFMTLYSAAGQQGLPMNETPFGIYWNSPNDTTAEELQWEIGFAVPADKEIKEPLKKKQWDYTLLVTTAFEGAFESSEMTDVYTKLYAWIDEHGYQQAGPLMEKFISNPMPNEKGDIVGKVEIVVPVEKKKK